MKQPVLKTSRLILEPFKTSDLPDIFTYASDPEISKFTTWESHRSLDDSKLFLDWIHSQTRSTDGQIFFVWAIREKISDKVIGSIDFKNIHPHSGQFDYALSREHWGKGFMTEAAKAVMHWAFEIFPKLVRFQAYCVSSNTGSKRVMEKCGLEFEGIRRKNILVRGVPTDTSHYALVK